MNEKFSTALKGAAVALVGAALALGGSTAVGAMRDPGHNHMGKGVTFECPACGPPLGAFIDQRVKAAFAAVAPQGSA